jgi:hypothetical protein
VIQHGSSGYALAARRRRRHEQTPVSAATSGLASRGSAKRRRSLSMSSRAGRVQKPRGFA